MEQNLINLIMKPNKTGKKTLWFLARKQIISTDQSPLMGEVSANFLQVEGVA
jgi:hypothetical protein